jgi:hypothetical protein
MLIRADAIRALIFVSGLVRIHLVRTSDVQGLHVGHDNSLIDGDLLRAPALAERMGQKSGWPLPCGAKARSFNWYFRFPAQHR